MTDEQTDKAKTVHTATVALNAAISEAHRAGLKVAIHSNEVQYAGDRWPHTLLEIRVYKELK